MKIHLIVKEINKILPQIKSNRKRMINFDLFDILKKTCDNIKITKSQSASNFYEQYWSRIQSLIGDKIKSIVE